MSRTNLTAFTLALAFVAAGASIPVRFDGTASAQAPSACALLTTEEIQPLAVKNSVAAGISSSLPASGYMACRYAWGTGVGRFHLDVAVTDATRMFVGANPEQIKQRLLESAKPEPGATAVPEIGEAAIFKSDSAADATATALVKGRVLQVHLDGLFAAEMKDQIIGLLKAAAARM